MKALKSAGCFQPSPALFQVLNSRVRLVATPCCNHSANVIFGEGNGTPLQYFCLENPMDGGAWWAAVHGVARVGLD